MTTISGNTAVKGGGIYLKQSMLASLDDILIVENAAELAGGGIYAHHGSLQFGEKLIGDTNIVSTTIQQKSWRRSVPLCFYD